MKKINIKHMLIGLSMLITAGVAIALTPREFVSDSAARIDLESMVPKQFALWHVDESIIPLKVSPDLQAELALIYSQTLSRTYINDKGERIMLSIAYGGTQSRSLQVHRPEVCYAAQGFQIQDKFKDTVPIGNASLPVMRLVAIQGQRIEPITYWVKIGDTAVRGNLEQGLARLKSGLTGTVPDGMLVRVSSVSADSRGSYVIQDGFIKQLISTLKPEHQAQLTGKL